MNSRACKKNQVSSKPTSAKKPVKSSNDTEVQDEQIYISMSDIPYDLMRFKINALSGAARREARKELLLKMGAARPKRENTNYHLLMQKRRDEKAADATLSSFRQSVNTVVNKQVPLKNVKRLSGKRKEKRKAKRKLKKSKRRREEK